MDIWLQLRNIALYITYPIISMSLTLTYLTYVNSVNNDDNSNNGEK